MSGIIKKKLAWNFLRPGVDLIKHFRSKFTRSFCKLDHFNTVNNIVSVQLKYLAYKIVQVILRQKGFKRLTPGRANIRLGSKMLTVVRWIVKRPKVMAHSSNNLEPSTTIYIPLIDNLFVLFIWNTRVSFSNGHFSTHAISYSLLCSISHLICSSLFLSLPLPLTPYSVFTCLHFI